MTTTMQPKPNYKRGDVVLVLFPHSDLRTAKLRPALVVQADDLQTGLPQVIVAMITSRLLRANHPSHVTVSLSKAEGRQSGLLTDSVVMTEQVRDSQVTLSPRYGIRQKHLTELVRS